MENKINRGVAPRKNREYSDEELKEIKEHLKKGRSDDAIAILFGRDRKDIAAVRRKIDWKVDHALVSKVRAALTDKVYVQKMPEVLNESQLRITCAMFYIKHPEIFENEGKQQAVEKKLPSAAPEPATPQLFPQEKTISDFKPRDMFRHLYDLGYRIDDKGIYIMVKQYVKLQDIISE